MECVPNFNYRLEYLFLNCLFLSANFRRLRKTAKSDYQIFYLGFSSPCIIIFQLNQPTRCSNFSSYYLSFKCSSPCFGYPHAHHQELQQLQQQPLVYRRNVVVAVLLVVVGPARPRPAVLLSQSSDGKPEAATAVVVTPDDGHEDARNMLSCI